MFYRKKNVLPKEKCFAERKMFCRKRNVSPKEIFRRKKNFPPKEIFAEKKCCRNFFLQSLSAQKAKLKKDHSQHISRIPSASGINICCLVFLSVITNLLFCQKEQSYSTNLPDKKKIKDSFNTT